MKKYIYILLFCVVIASIMTIKNRTSKKQETLTIVTYSCFNTSPHVIKLFEEKNNVNVKFIRAKSIKVALNQAILSKENPIADLFFGIDNVCLGQALHEDLFMKYKSPLLSKIPNHLKLDPSNKLLPVDFGDICFIYDIKWFKEHNLPPPTSLEDLTKERYKGLTVISNPAFSGVALGLLMTTIGAYGEDEYLNFWQRLNNNDLLIETQWTGTYQNKFSVNAPGGRPIVIAYGTTPVNDLIQNQRTTIPSAPILTPGSVLRQIEFVGIFKRSNKIELAKKFVDFMLDKDYQEDIPLQQFVFPANVEAHLPELFKEHAKIAKNPIMLEPDLVRKKYKTWMEEWSKLIIK